MLRLKSKDKLISTVPSQITAETPKSLSSVIPATKPEQKEELKQEQKEEQKQEQEEEQEEELEQEQEEEQEEELEQEPDAIDIIKNLKEQLQEQKTDLENEFQQIQKTFGEILQKKTLGPCSEPSSSPAFFPAKKSPSIADIFSKESQNEIWRFFVEGYRQQDGLTPFRESYFKSLGDCFLTVSGEQKLSIELIQKIHSSVTKGVYDIKSYSRPGEFRYSEIGSYFDMTSRNATKDGIRNLYNKFISESAILPPNSYIMYYNDGTRVFHSKKNITLKNIEQCVNSTGSEDISYAPKFYDGSNYDVTDLHNEIKILLEKNIEIYYTKIQSASTTVAKMTIILDTIQNFEQIHPFGDGNCRTFCMILFSHLCLQNGFPPPMFFDANTFDGFSVEELTYLALDGMKNTMRLLNGETNFYGITTEELFSNEGNIDIIEELNFMKEIYNKRPRDKRRSSIEAL